MAAPMTVAALLTHAPNQRARVCGPDPAAMTPVMVAHQRLGLTGAPAPQVPCPMSKAARLARQLEVFRPLDGPVRALITRHRDTRKDWQPGELVDFGGEDGLLLMDSLRDRARGLHPSVKVAVTLNLLTEEGLPNFHRIIHEHFGSGGPWEEWTRLWTAEEDRHGNAMRDYVRDAALVSIPVLDRMQFTFLHDGFNPEWAGSPYRLLAYTSLQEKATQMSHANTARLAASQEPLLQRVLAYLAGDELRHCAFYRDAFGLALAQDLDGALMELAEVACGLSMPGQTIPGYQMMAEVERRAGIFGPRQYADIVEESLAYWQVAVLRPLSGDARSAQERLLELPDRLRKLAGRLEQRSRAKTFEFDFLREPLVALAA